MRGIGFWRWLTARAIIRDRAASCGTPPSGRGASMNRRDWVLLALAAAPDRRLQPVQLQKSLFLVSQKLDAAELGEFYEFEPYDYGPFCSAIYDDADCLAREGLIEIVPQPRVRWREYVATAAGDARAHEAESEAAPDAVEYLRRAVEWTTHLSFVELIRAIYAHFPEFKANSVFKDPA